MKLMDTIIETLAKTGRAGMPELLTWLSSTDFYRAPASTKYHLCHGGGLAEHCWNVYTQLRKINAEHNLNIPEASVAVMGLLHDVCKVDCYKRETKRARVNGEWIDQEGWSFVDSLPIGHGEKSVILIQQFMALTPKEMLAIRWHMGPWDATSYSQMRDLNNAMSSEAGPWVKALQLADLTSAWMIEK